MLPTTMVVLLLPSLGSPQIPESSSPLPDQEIPEEKGEEDEPALVATPLSSVAGHMVELPCDARPSIGGDQLLLILWYKIGTSSPVYTFDVRYRPAARARVYSDQTLFEEPTRAVMGVDRQPAALVISNLIPADEGLYKCRVDFKRSPTKHFLLNLTVIAPPHPPSVYDGSGKRMQERLGPFRTGDKLQATCVSLGGDPAPSLAWWREGRLIDGEDEEVNGQTINSLEVGNLTMEDNGKPIQCRAANNEVTPPAVTSLTLYIAYPPSTVALAPPPTLTAGELATFTCAAANLSGEATFLWFLGQSQLYDQREEVGEAGVVSTLRCPQLLQCY